MVREIAIITHSEPIYDKRGAIVKAIDNLSVLEQILVTSQSKSINAQGTIHS